jgi:hypothetical protein
VLKGLGHAMHVQVPAGVESGGFALTGQRPHDGSRRFSERLRMYAT